MDGKDGKALEQKNGHRLLIVEDDCLMAEGMADYFIGKGWETDVAEEGDRALELLEQKSYHLILLDVMMPGNPQKQRRSHYLHHGPGIGGG